MVALSIRTEKLLEKIFPEEETRNIAKTRLIEECGNNIPDCKHSSPEQLERIRFSVLKLSGGDLTRLENAIELAKIDWRDLFMSAGFGKDVNEHNNWYEYIIGD